MYKSLKMSALIQIISVTTYSLSIAIVVLSRKKEYHFARLRKPWISDAIMISLNCKHELFRQYKNGTVTFDHYNSFKNNFTTTLRLAKNSYFQRKFTECSNNSKYKWKTLNCLIRCRKTSKDVTLNHNGSSISDPSAIVNYLIAIFRKLPPILIAIFLIQIHLHCISNEYQWKIHFSAPP